MTVDQDRCTFCGTTEAFCAKMGVWVVCCDACDDSDRRTHLNTIPSQVPQELFDNVLLEWASWPTPRCKAVRERRGGRPDYFGRCNLTRYHTGDHALERGMEIVRWSTDWTN
jgi:hypothetical protein